MRIGRNLRKGSVKLPFLAKNGRRWVEMGGSGWRSYVNIEDTVARDGV